MTVVRISNDAVPFTPKGYIIACRKGYEKNMDDLISEQTPVDVIYFYSGTAPDNILTIIGEMIQTCLRIVCYFQDEETMIAAIKRAEEINFTTDKSVTVCDKDVPKPTHQGSNSIN